MKKLIYSMESKNRLNNILATGDALFFAIQLIIVEIHTRLTSQSLLNIKAIVILMVVNLLIVFLVRYVIDSMFIHDFKKKVNLISYKIDSYTLSKASGKEFYTIRTDDDVKVIDKDRVEVVHVEVSTSDKAKVGTTEVIYNEFKIPDDLPEYQFNVFSNMFEHAKQPRVMTVFKYVDAEVWVNEEIKTRYKPESRTLA